MSDLEAILQAVVVGGNRIAEQKGAKKQRLRVPDKQERLIRAVVEAEELSFEVLSNAFKKEWAQLEKRGGHLRTRKRALYRNLSELAERINEALQEAEVPWRLQCNQQDFTIAIRTQEPQRKAPPPPEPPREKTDAVNTLPAELVVAIDGVTGAWRFEIDDTPLELHTGTGLLKVAGRLYPFEHARHLSEPEELTDDILQLLQEKLADVKAGFRARQRRH